LRIQNLVGESLGQFTLSYTGEQWRKENNASVHSIIVDYKLGATAVNDASGWTTIGELTFNSPIAGATTAGALDGNASANRVVFSPVSVNLNWVDGEDLWIRWVSLNDAGSDHQLAIDDLSFQANIQPVPEPAEWGLICAVGLLGVCGLHTWRERRRAQRQSPSGS